MKYGSLILEKNDFLMTRKFMKQNCIWEDYIHTGVLEILDLNLNNAVVLDEGRMPSDIVRLYSEVTLVGSSDHRDSFRLVPPGEEDPMTNQISVTSSLGASLIGFSKGDRITYGLPGSKISFTIEKVKQGRQKVKLSISDGDMQKMVPEQ
ncbi:GreA/GreB family elongation factor [Flagellimonas abyssi]|uniref:GreA/GreB family elongation factor n=1 Tax=Flagellimonas abyssi TaxID=2864871 RepID=A0ABS7EUH8_9FLAO|nr:GreA/GreB family elongation factor [Allomuricauda abyssi]MBW8201267.1 GreA/GreB family elongation factor [Allomuricauda abyssi]